MSKYIMLSLIASFIGCGTSDAPQKTNDLSDARDTFASGTAVHADEGVPKSVVDSFPRLVTFTVADSARIDSALVAARAASTDTLFVALLRHMDERGELHWGRLRFRNVPKANRDSAATYFLARYARHAQFKRDSILPYEWPPDVMTMASTIPSTGWTKLNVTKLNRSVASIAGTLVHERGHDLGQIHIDNTAVNNRCDFAYVAGDLVAAIHRYRAAGSKTVAVSPDPECPHLVSHLRARQIYPKTR
jgi:hypothetical protein